MKKVTTINSAPRLPNWRAAADAMRRNESALSVLAHLLSIDPNGTREELESGVLNELAAQRSPAISVYDRRYTAHIYPEPEVSDGQVYEALRDYAAQHATPDTAMVEIRNRGILELLDKWLAEGPPSPDDIEFWRQFDADLARAKRGADSPAAVELEQKLAQVRELLTSWTDDLPNQHQDMNVWQMRDELAKALGDD